MTPLWSWATATYARPGAAEACLALQDARGQNVPLLLWAAWAARHGRTPDTSRAAALARAWETAAGTRLREARRALKAPIADLPDAARERVREAVKAVELAGERALLEALEPLTAQGQVDPVDSLMAAAAAWGAPLDRGTAEALLQRL